MNAVVGFLNHLAAHWWVYVANAAWQSSLVALVLLALALTLRRAPSPLRYGLLTVALLKFAIPPMLTLPMGLPVGVFGHVESPVAPVAPVADIVPSAPPIAVSNAAVGFPESARSAGPAAADRVAPPAGQGAAGSSSSGSVAPWDRRVALGTLASVSPGGFGAISTLTAKAWLMLAHAAGAVLLSLFFIVQWVRLRRAVREADELRDGAAYDLLESLARRLGLRRAPRLMLADASAPMAFGVVSPVVMLPRSLVERLGAAELEAVLGHELAHHRRRDPLAIMLQLLLAVAWWCHPLYWLLVRVLRRVREDCCDDLLLARALTSSETYCATLLRTGRELTRALPVGATLGFAESLHPLGRRLRRIMDLRQRRAWRLSFAGTLFVALAAAVLLPGTRTQSAEPDQTTVGIVKPPTLGEAILSGHVTDQSGRPVADASVQPQPDSRDLPYPRSVKTDAQGVYVFGAALQPGKYHLSVQAAGFIGIRTSPTMPVVDLQPLSKTVKDFALPAACRAELLTTDEAGKSLAGVRLSIAVLSTERFLPYNGIPDVQSDAQGKALLDGVPPIQGEYQVTAMHSDFAPARATLKMDDSKTTYTATIAMSKGVEVKGRAICEDGQPAAGWSIAAQPDWWNSLTMPKPSPIGENGDFTLEHIAPGKYAIQILVPEGNGMTAGHPVTTMLLPPESGSLDLKVPLASPKSAVAISGTVSIPGHEIESNVEVDAVGDNHSRGYQTIMSGDKDFTIGNLKPGVYDLHFQSVQAKEKTVKGVQAPSSALKVELEWVGKPKLRGVAVVAATSQPLTRFKTRVRKVKTLSGPGYTGDVQWHDAADPQGHFDVDLIGPGVYQVEVAADGFAPLWSADYNSDTDSTKTLTLALTPGATLRGRVQDEQGKAIAGAKVIPLSQAGGGWQTDAYGFASEEGATISAADGTFSFAHLPPGRETLKAVQASYCPAVVREIELKEGATTPEPPIVLTQGGAVAGHVYDAQGKPQAGVTLVVRDVSGQPRELEACRLAVVTSGADGSYRAEHLPELPCYIQRSDEMVYEGVAHRAILPVAGQTLPLDFGGAGGQSDCVRGRLLVDGKPEPGRHVGVYGDSSYYGGFVSRVTADGKGEFAFQNVPPGRWSLYVEKSAGHFDWPKAKTFDVSPGMEKERGTLDLGDVTPPAGRVVVRLGAALAQLPPESIGDMWVVAPEGDSPGGRGVGQVESRREKGAPLVVTELCPGHYKASASAGGAEDRVQFFQSFDLKEGEKELVVTVGPSAANATVTGKSSLKEDRPIVLMSQDKRVMAVARSEGGRYRLGNLPAGEYLFLDSTRDMSRPIRRLTLAEGETATVDLDGPEWDRPEPAGLGVTVFTAAGQLLPGAQLWIEGQGTTRRPTNERDTFSNFMTAPGDYVLHVAFPGYREAQQKVTISPAPAGEPYYKDMKQVRVRLEAE